MDDTALIDTSGLTLEELRALVDEDELERALDHILDGHKDRAGYNGFNSVIG